MHRFDIEPFMAEIMMVPFNYPPKGWALCNGQLLPINQNQALFSLLGTTYGGNGQTNFALPDLRGKVPIHVGNSFVLGQKGGAEAHTLTMAELPTHTHPLSTTDVAAKVGGTANTADPLNNYFANKAGLTTRFSKRPDTLARPNEIDSQSIGGGQAHTNMMPSLTINFVIALQGIFPSPADYVPERGPFVAEIIMVPFTFAPRGWAQCDGQLLPISQNTALFSLLGTTYDGDGKSTFALPDMRGCAPMAQGQGNGLSLRDLGERAGTSHITLVESEIPQHTHTAVPVIQTGGTATTVNPDNAMPAVALNNEFIYSTTAGTGTTKPMAARQDTNPEGGGQGHNNMQPYLTLNFIIALQGIFPQRP